MAAPQANSYKPISDYGLIGDCRTAALVSRGGSIDWCCLPNFDSASVFGRLLDSKRGGHFSIRPTAQYEVEQTYIEGTNVLTTAFTTPDGSVRLTDFMPIPSKESKKQYILPMRQILRHIEGVFGAVEMEVKFEPRPFYGAGRHNLISRSPHNFVIHGREWQLQLLSSHPLIQIDDRAEGKFCIRAGDQATLSLGYDEYAPEAFPATGQLVTKLLDDTIGFWKSWIEKCDYEGSYYQAVQRSALLLKLIEFAPSGAIIAAPTTSLPEKVGGVRNWDYRFCWLRDASMTLEALQDIGYTEEAEAFLNWLFHSTRLTHPRFQVVYSIFGDSSVTQRELEHMEGYLGSSPVRVGNQADGQYQLDVYGEVIDGLFRVDPERCELSRDARGVIAGAADYVADHWMDADHGIWEMQEKGQFTHSKALCWLALDRATKLLERCGMSTERTERWEKVRDEITVFLQQHCYNQKVKSFTQRIDGQAIDAAALSFSILGIIDPHDPRMVSTVKAIQEKLTVNGHVYRYLSGDGLPPGEGTFSVCTFWLAHSLALQGKLNEARAIFENAVNCANHLGLLSEEIDPYTEEALGNFPQGLTHIGLINAAVAIQHAEEGYKRP